MEVIGEFLAVVHMIPTAVVSMLNPVILTLFAKDTGPFFPLMKIHGPSDVTLPFK